MNGGNLDRRVQFRRYVEDDDGYGLVQIWADHGLPVWASKVDLSDGEKWRAGEVAASVTTRFAVRASQFTRDITPKDRLMCNGASYEISGIKEGKGRGKWLELTCAARIDV